MKSIGNVFKRKDPKGTKDKRTLEVKEKNPKNTSKNTGSKPDVALKNATMPKSSKKQDKKSNAYVQGQRDLVLKKKDDPFVNFGSVIEQFLNSDRIGRRKIKFEYDDSRPKDEKFTVFELTYAVLAPTGMSYGETVTEDLDEYMSKRHTLFGSSEVPTAKWATFVKEILIRLQIEISSIPPPNLTNLVIENVKRHLAPIELGLVNLTESEWNRIDTRRVMEALKAQRDILKPRYPSGRDEYINSSIKEPKTLPIEPVRWADYGISNLSRSDMLTNYCHQNLVSKTEEAKVSALEKAILKAATEATDGT